MKVLMTNATTVKGGAARASIRNYKALKNAGLDIRFVAEQVAPDQSNFIAFTHSYIKQKYHKLVTRMERSKIKKNVHRSSGYWSLSSFNRFNVRKQLNSHKVDIIHLNWINDNFLSIDELGQLDKPVVWTFHDMWAFTGGCHYAGNCEGYKTACGNCPSLQTPSPNDFTKQLLARKIKAYSKLNLTIACPSTWMAEMAKQSVAFGQNVNIEVLPNCLDVDVYKPQNQKQLIEDLNIRPGKKRILFGAVNSLDDERKGGKYLLEALKLLGNNKADVDKVELLVFGAEKDDLLNDLPFDVTFLGFIRDEALLAKVYGVADLFCVTSTEDNLPNTILESMACGTPVIAYDRGGIKDMVQHNITGYLAKPFVAEDYVNGIRELLYSSEDVKLRTQCRQFIMDNFSEDVIAEKHIDLYQRILKVR